MLTALAPSAWCHDCHLAFAFYRYEVLTFSRPAHPLAYASYPLVRFYQRRYGNDSATAIAEAMTCSPENGR